MNTSHAVPGRPISNRKFLTGDPRKSGNSQRDLRDYVLTHPRPLPSNNLLNLVREVPVTGGRNG